MSDKLLKQVLNVYGIVSAGVVIREDISSEQLVDFLIGNRTYTQSLAVLNKIDLVNRSFLTKFSKKVKTEYVSVSAESETNIELLKEKIYEKLNFIRIYMKPKGGEIDYKEPLIIRDSSKIGDVCNKLHRKMKKEFRYALVWGKSVKYAGQRVGINHILQDEDVLTIIKRKGI